MPSLVKKLITSEYEREFAKADGMVVVAMERVTVKELEKLRRQMVPHGVRLRMVRNSLVRRVLKERGLQFSDGVIAGNVGFAYGTAEAAIHAAKLLTTPEIKKSGKLALRGGMLENTVLSPADTAALAKVPDKNTLRSQLIGCIQGPSRSLVSLLNANQSSVVRVLQARVDQAPPAPESPAESTPAS
jgi:large subunit ribosomal protein L10